MKRSRVSPGVVVLVLVICVLGYFFHPKSGVQIFKGIEGPSAQTIVPPSVDASWTDYAGGTNSRVAILLTDVDSNWLGLAHGLKSIGVPFLITTSIKDALKHKVVIVYPSITGSWTDKEGFDALRAFPAQGGTLIGFQVLGGGLEDVFGFDKAVPSLAHSHIDFTQSDAESDPKEMEIPVDHKGAGANAMGSYAYTNAKDAIAVYEDGSAAILTAKVGQGRAVAFGFDLGLMLLRGYNNRQDDMARSYDNGYEPTLDVLLRLMQKLYAEGEKGAVTMSPVPDGKDLAVILTHDIDFTKSLVNALDYARFEKSQNIRATYFVQAKYIKDYSDDIILTDQAPRYLQQLRDLGMEIASHSVAHSPQFAHFPLGDGTETYPRYHPFVKNTEVTTGGTILGELRVSRFLIESLSPGLHLTSFRPGHLSNPYQLPQALAATGFLYSSSVTANDSLTHLPFQLDYGRDETADVPVFEFPVTIEDEQPRLSSSLPQRTDLAKTIARHKGLCVVLIHPNVIEPKLSFEKNFVAGVKTFSWFGALEDYGAWWSARNQVALDTRWNDGLFVIHGHAPVPLEGLTLMIPEGLRPIDGQAAIVKSDGQQVVLGRVQDDFELTFMR